MDDFTRRQLLALCADFYRAHATAFDASRAHHAWPGWLRVFAALGVEADRSRRPAGAGAPLRVLDIGCGNARLAAFLDERLRAQTSDPDRLRLRYVGVDANATLLAAARTRLPADRAATITLIEQDFLAAVDAAVADAARANASSEAGAGSDPGIGSALPIGPFDLVALFGVLHHVPGGDARLALLTAARARLAAGGVLALTAWQFADRPRFRRRRADWSALSPLLGAPIDPARLEPGDQLLRFGDDPDKPPRYCHQISDAELDDLPEALDLRLVDAYRADGAEGDSNRYLVLQRPLREGPAER